MFPYGAVYKVYREHSLDTVKKNLKSIKELGMNFAVIWPAVYWWEDKNLPGYPYNTGHEILRYAEEIGLKIIMETAGQITCLEYAPNFAMKEDYYAVTKDGLYSRDNNHHYFEYINYFHPEVKKLMKDYLEGIATNYQEYSSLYGYDIWNETMFESYDEHTMKAFQRWLKVKYSTIDKLNDAWENTYSDWEQIRYSQLLWASVMPYVDYKEFHKDSIAEILIDWRNTVKRIDPGHPVIADNIQSMITDDWTYYERATDEWTVSRVVDEYGISFYPKHDQTPMEPYKRAMVFSAVHSATPNGRFWISEMQTHHQAIYNPFGAVYPHELRWWDWEAISRGAKGLIYWKLNTFQKGWQTFGRGLINSSGEYTERALEAQSIGGILSENADIFSKYCPQKPKVAILYDRLCHDFTKAYTFGLDSSVKTIYTDSLAGLYKCLWEENIAADFVIPEMLINGKINEYEVLFITGQINLSKELADGISCFIEQGGIVVCDGKFGDVDDNSLLYSRIPGGGLSDFTGFDIGDMDPNNLDMKLEWGSDNYNLKGYFEKRFVKITDNKVVTVACFEDGSPAIVSVKKGKGELIYIGTLLWYGFLKNGEKTVKQFMNTLIKKYPMAQYNVADNTVKLAISEGTHGKLIYIFNYSEKDVSTTVVLNNMGAEKYFVKELYPGGQSFYTSESNMFSMDVTVKALDVNIYHVIKQEVAE